MHIPSNAGKNQQQKLVCQDMEKMKLQSKHLKYLNIRSHVIKKHGK